ncbi:CRISPR-associated endonuclease Cas2 [Thermanaerothrix sp. 4228-RoL]|uniref:CRISPR-associated endoribonuclease Cas2 n=1 Tax=Thermanaerothrix solaris TaxID=3058434 RepID=A0ABU3NPB6_9CHLR|nr:CRISPR-associated endonuclease Cas2 [Thermanaerothrix sp. 4228-RoL]MDT8898210.1 CRISPR-associated endonuclease Cas2 [Thermanaerothrix sp. 4228-RoL]
MDERAFYVLAYDIADDRRRLKIARLMESLGERVQESVFEAYLTPRELERLLKRVERVLVVEEDSLRIYRLCGGCKGTIRTLGRARLTPPPGAIIV